MPGHALVQQVYSEKSRELMRILSAVDFKQCLVFSNYQMRYSSWIDILCHRHATAIKGRRRKVL